MTATSPILPEITKRGQPYKDEPVFIYPKRPSELQWAVWGALGVREEYTSYFKAEDGNLYRRIDSRRIPPPIQVEWQRVFLNWTLKNDRAQSKEP